MQKYMTIDMGKKCNYDERKQIVEEGESEKMNINRIIRHTANAGVTVKMGGNGIGIDLFSRDPQGLYPDTPGDVKEELLEEIEHGKIRTLVFTHEHGDHFCLEDAVQAFRRNRNIRIISTKEVIRQLKGAGVPMENMYQIKPEETGTVRMEVPGYLLTFFNSRHMGEAYQDVQNLVCILEAEGVRIVILGDAQPQPELFARIESLIEEIELLIGPFPLAGIPSNRRMMKHMRIRRILAVHLPRPERDEQGWIESAKKVCGRAEDELGQVVFGEEIGKAYREI